MENIRKYAISWQEKIVICYSALVTNRILSDGFYLLSSTYVQCLELQYWFPGMGMVDGILNIIPNAKIGHIGLYRNEDTFKPIEYYYKIPEGISEREAIVIDPMLATGESASAAISRLKQDGVSKIKLLCIVAAPQGIKTVEEDHPDVEIFCAAVDRELNETHISCRVLETPVTEFTKPNSEVLLHLSFFFLVFLMWKVIWPILIVILSNTFYNICMKSMPGDVNAFCALMVTYLVAAIVSGIIFVFTAGSTDVSVEISKISRISFVSALTIAGLESGYVFFWLQDISYTKKTFHPTRF